MIDWLIDTTFYTGLLIAAVLLLRRPVARAFGPQIAYALWALPALRLLLPRLVLPACFAPTQIRAPQAAESLRAISGPLDIAAVAEPVVAAPTAPLAPEPLVALAWSEIVLSLWIGGALAFLAWRVSTYRRMRHEVLAEARPVGEVGRVRLVETPAVGAPVAFGVRDKVVALPPLFMAQPDRAARDLAIAHELAHHRGHDLLANFAAQALLALHWFNPIAWLGWRAMRRDQEAACDARVLAGRGRGERALYAALIAGAAAGPRLALAAPMACPVLGEVSILHRLRSLSRREVSPRRRWAGRGLLAAGALALPLSASITFAAEDRQPEPPVVPAAPTPPTPPAPSMSALSIPPAPLAAPAVPPMPHPPQAPLSPEAPAAPLRRARVAEEHARHAAEARSHALVARRQAEAAAGEANALRIRSPLDPREVSELERDAARLKRAAIRQARDATRLARGAEQITRRLEQEIEVTVSRALAESGTALAMAETGRAHALVTRELATALSRDSGLIACATAGAGSHHETRCEEQAVARSLEALHSARRSIAADPAVPEEIRREVLKELDAELADLRPTS